MNVERALRHAAMTPRLALLALLLPSCSAYLVVSVTAYGAVADNVTDNTAAFRAAFAAVRAAAGGEVRVPAAAAPSPSIFKTGPFNISSNTAFTVDAGATVWAVEDALAFPHVETPPSYLSSFPPWRHHPFIWAPNATNVTIRGGGVLNGGGPYWWTSPEAHQETRPHLLELNNVTKVEVTGVTLHNSAFWTFRPIYCRDVWIHDMRIEETYGAGDNTDGIDIDSSSDVIVERNYVSCGDDHFTVLAGAGASGRAVNISTHNVTIRDNVLGTGMGMSIGSSVSGGVEDVLYTRNVMTEGRYVNASTYGAWGQGAHIKTRVSYGCFIRRISYIDNVIRSASTQGILVETDYQSSGGCNATTCTEISDILWRNFTVDIVGTGAGNGGPGQVSCFKDRPCRNFTFEDIRINTTARWSCSNLEGITVTNVSPPGLASACGL
jgi:polygalacturonase